MKIPTASVVSLHPVSAASRPCAASTASPAQAADRAADTVQFVHTGGSVAGATAQAGDTAAIASALTAAMRQFQTAGEALYDGVESAANLVGDGADLVGGAAQAVGQGLENAARAAGRQLADAADAVGEGLCDAADALLEAAGSVVVMGLVGAAGAEMIAQLD